MKPLLAFNIGQNIPWGRQNLSSSFPNLASLISILLKNALTLAGLILLVLILLGGFMYIANAGGDPKKLEQSQSVITNALIGFAVVFCAYFIIQIIEVLTGVPILNSGL